MAGVSGFEHDIFISYSRKDNKTATEKEKGWITLFISNLEIFLNKSGIEPKIWFDKDNIGKSQAFNPILEEAIQNSAIFISMTSDSSLKSKYCEQERDSFFVKAQDENFGLEIDNFFRIINIQLAQFPKKDWPPVFSGKEGFPFYDSSGIFPIEPTESEFRNRIKELAVELRKFLNLFKNEVQHESLEVEIDDNLESDEKPVESNDKNIYFAEVNENLADLKKAVIHDLESMGYRISCDSIGDLPKGEEKIVDNLRQADLSVHLFDQNDSLVDSKTSTFNLEQAELATRNAKSQIIWVPRDQKVERLNESSYKKFIRSLENGTYTTKDHFDYIKGTKSKGPLTSEIVAFSELMMKEEAANQPQKPKMMVATHEKDQEFAYSMKEYLNVVGADIIFNPMESNPRSFSEDWERRLSEINKLVFLYGKVDQEWVFSRIIKAAKSVVGRAVELVVLLYPEKKDPQEIDISNVSMQVIDNSESGLLTPDNIQKLVKVTAA